MLKIEKEKNWIYIECEKCGALFKYDCSVFVKLAKEVKVKQLTKLIIGCPTCETFISINFKLLSKNKNKINLVQIDFIDKKFVEKGLFEFNLREN